MCERVKLTPLTPEEQLFAQENHSSLLWGMRVQHLDNDLYDVAAMAYLLAVKKWFARPDLRRWSFRTIVNQSIRSSISNEDARQKRRIQTISLDAVIPGTEDFTYGETITYDHMNYLYKERGEVDMAVKMNYDIAIPAAAKLGRTSSVEIEKLVEFLDSKHTTMSFEYSDKKESASKRSALSGWKKNNKREDFNVYRLAETVYIEKIKPKQTGRKQICQ